ncbi:hypothetical protein CR513_36283, partial [Mucuna pruriens]
MDIPENRRWIYRRLDANKCWMNEFTEGVHEFLLLKRNFSYKTNHGKQLPQFPPMVVEGSYYASSEQRKEFNPYKKLIMDH